MLQLSVILPCHNEADNIPACYAQLTDILSPTTTAYECIFVDDGSTDHTLKVIQSLCRKDSRIRYIYRSSVGLAFIAVYNLTAYLRPSPAPTNQRTESHAPRQTGSVCPQKQKLQIYFIY